MAASWRIGCGPDKFWRSSNHRTSLNALRRHMRAAPPQGQLTEARSHFGRQETLGWITCANFEVATRGLRAALAGTATAA
jgi:hypothetical protein